METTELLAAQVNALAFLAYGLLAYIAARVVLFFVFLLLQWRDRRLEADYRAAQLLAEAHAHLHVEKRIRGRLKAAERAWGESCRDRSK